MENIFRHLKMYDTRQTKKGPERPKGRRNQDFVVYSFDVAGKFVKLKVEITLNSLEFFENKFVDE